MQYREDRYGKPISILGYGCMRFSKKGAKIDIDKAEKEVMEAIRAGVNYLDTAYIYPGSEVAVGEILEGNKCRGQVAVATKLPHYLIKSKDSIEKCFQEQLSRLKTSYIDYYLMHMLTDFAMWEKLKRLGIEEWIEKKKESGEIVNLGFSFHGNTDTFLEILNDYDWDFCQIQYNYLDENTQAGRKGLMAAAEKGIPVIIMEPLRGGKLVNLLPDGAKKQIENHKKKRTPAEWALRWLWDQPEVTCVLSGMNSIEMVRENIKIASNAAAGEFDRDDFALIDSVKKEIEQNIKVNCTGCGYCMPCPHGVDIPTAFQSYNHMYTEKKSAGRMEYLQIIALQKEMSDMYKCVGCGKCELHCPQQVPIRKKLKEAGRQLMPWYWRAGVFLVRLFKFW